jgi:hypothetical protein
VVKKSIRGGENTIKFELECIQHIPTIIIVTTQYKNQIKNLLVEHLLQVATLLEFQVFQMLQVD